MPEEFRPWIPERVTALTARQREVETAARVIADGALRAAAAGDRAELAAFVIAHAREGDPGRVPAARRQGRHGPLLEAGPAASRPADAAALGGHGVSTGGAQ